MSAATEVVPALQLVQTVNGNPNSTDAKTDIKRHLPSPSAQRKLESLQETPFNLEATRDGAIHEFDKASDPATVFYLAYGSNLSAETFQGRRGIRPISQVNVVVPELVMTFDLAGLPYLEPCFANTRFRNPKPVANDDGKTALVFDGPSDKGYRKTQWKKGLVGVVYEITTKDYATIIATEGGGASYQDILIDCYELTPGEEVVPTIPTSQPFKTHTLFCPLHAPGQKPSKGERFSRLDPNYAQASPRYLKLITDGADEHSLPQEYKTYLHSLRPYLVTTSRQKIGRSIFMLAWAPILSLLFPLSRRFADKQGKAPRWLQTLLSSVFQSLWFSYDSVFKHLFGDGERTIGDNVAVTGAK